MNATGIICPCRQELEPFYDAIDNMKRVQIKKLEFLTGDICGKPVVLCSSGVGKVNSAVVAQMMTDRFDVGAIIVSGAAGGTDDRIELFDTVICDTALYHDFAAGCLKSESPYMSEAVFKAGRSLTECLRETDYIFGCMASGDYFVDDRNRMRIAEKFGALCADMETAAVAHCCYINEVPFTAVRTITDTKDCSGIKNCLANIEKAAKLSAAAVIEILKNR